MKTQLLLGFFHNFENHEWDLTCIEFEQNRFKTIKFTFYTLPLPLSSSIPSFILYSIRLLRRLTCHRWRENRFDTPSLIYRNHLSTSDSLWESVHSSSASSSSTDCSESSYIEWIHSHSQTSDTTWRLSTLVYIPLTTVIHPLEGSTTCSESAESSETSTATNISSRISTSKFAKNEELPRKLVVRPILLLKNNWNEMLHIVSPLKMKWIQYLVPYQIQNPTVPRPPWLRYP